MVLMLSVTFIAAPTASLFGAQQNAGNMFGAQTNTGFGGFGAQQPQVSDLNYAGIILCHMQDLSQANTIYL
jgi:hypothetical protein